MPRRFLELDPQQLREIIEQVGQPSYRAAQLADWVYRKGIIDPKQMTNVPASLSASFTYLTSSTAVQLQSADGTMKLLLRLSDKQHVEAVAIPSAGRLTACVSTQVGCSTGCRFCASGIKGLRRNLSTGEILEQLIHLRNATGRAATNVVFMGIGEPLANYAATVKAVRAIIDPQRFGISARNVTVSTVGLARQIRRLAAEKLPITLAISLHAPNDELRRSLIPAARRTSVRQIISAAQEFFRSRGREVTIEYVLLRDVNDSTQCAAQLADICKQLRCNVNLIRYNPIAALPYEPPSRRAVQQFADVLRSRSINVHVRTPRGLDINAACGQLRLQSESETTEDESK